MDPTAAVTDTQPAQAERAISTKKAKVGLGTVVTMTWKTEGKPEDCKWMPVKLSVPSADEECPITQELMCSPGSDLDFLPGVTFRNDNPEYRRMELPCGHFFSAMCLTYHFFKNGMLCPLCRSGHEETLAPVCVPIHFRRKMQSHLASERAHDRAEADRENLATAMLVQEASYHTLLASPGFAVQRIHLMMPRFMEQDTAMLRLLLDEDTRTESEREEERLTTFLQHHRMCLNVYAYEQSDQVVPVAVMEFPLDMWTLPPTAVNTPVLPEPLGASASSVENMRNVRPNRQEGAGPDPSARVLSGSMQLRSLRELGRNLRPFQHPMLFRFVLGTRSLSNSVVELARTELVSLDDPTLVPGAFGGAYVASNVPGIGFEIRHLEGREDQPRELDSVVWYTEERTFLNFALECILQGQGSQWRRLLQSHPSETVIVID